MEMSINKNVRMSTLYVHIRTYLRRKRSLQDQISN